MAIGQNRKTANFHAHRLPFSRSKRLVPLQHCHIYATNLLLTFFRTIIPFTLSFLHNPARKKQALAHKGYRP